VEVGLRYVLLHFHLTFTVQQTDRVKGAVLTGKEKKAGQVGSVTLVSPGSTAGVAPTPALIEQVTCPSLVEEARANSPDAAALKSSGSSLFSIRPSPKGGMGAFALSDIPCSTVIMRELALFLATDGNGHLAEELGKLSAEERAEFRKLACYDLLDKDKDIAIFKTNRYVWVILAIPFRFHALVGSEIKHSSTADLSPSLQRYSSSTSPFHIFIQQFTKICISY
jgi:hypothetical protein